jgi:hypothetical protein
MSAPCLPVIGECGESMNRTCQYVNCGANRLSWFNALRTRLLHFLRPQWNRGDSFRALRPHAGYGRCLRGGISALHTRHLPSFVSRINFVTSGPKVLGRSHPRTHHIPRPQQPSDGLTGLWAQKPVPVAPGCLSSRALATRGFAGASGHEPGAGPARTRLSP